MSPKASKRAAALAAALCLALASAAGAVVLQEGGLRITVLSQVQPYKLPRHGTAPIAVFVGGSLKNASGGIPPQLNQLDIKVNRHGLLQSKGLAVCDIDQIQPASTERALEACGPAVIGSGQFWAHIVLAGQAPYPTHGRLLIFNGKKKGKPLLLAHIYTSNPFNASFVVSFAMKKVHQGPYSTELKASFPDALGNWGYVDRIKLTLKRKYTYKGKQLSYFNAGCPAPGNASRTVFPLAYVTFSFAGRKDMGAKVNKACGVKGP